MPQDLHKVRKLKVYIITLICILGFSVISLIPFLVNNLHKRNVIDKHLQQVKQVTQEIIYFDEVLTMTARMYAFTRDVSWEKRYLSTAKQLEQSLANAQLLEPNVAQAIQATSMVNDQLVAIEVNAIEFVKKDMPVDAQLLLLNDHYYRLKSEYERNVLSALEEAIHHNEGVLLNRITRTKHWLFASAFVLSILFLSLVIYFYAYNKKTESLILAKISLLNSKVQELEELAIELDSANSAKSELLAKVSHELKTPLNGIHGSLQLIQSQPTSNDNLELANQALSCSEMLIKLVNELLDFSTLKTGNYELHTEEFNLLYLINTVRQVYTKQCHDKNIDFHFTHQVQHLHRLGDYPRLKQVIFNVLNNAVQYTHSGSVSFVLKEQESPDVILIEVTDTGIGMDQNTLDNLYSEFEQADNSITRLHGGSGLGMPLVKSLVELMDGKIHVSSTVNVGSKVTIQVRVPIKGNVTPREKISRDLNYLEGLQNLNVLIVEDNKVNQIILSKLLERIGINAKLTNNGQEALDAVTTATQLVLMDIQMPVMDGITACQYLKQSHPTLPIVAVTANVQPSEIELYLRTGFDDVVSKPINMDPLFDVIYRVLETSQTRYSASG
ncbi:hybrid sensor histidine kinase/response regulator [Vibrio sonorensis]|uniref:hybrid sensor histidine kinase/response regulator n=1 Tax=Vibrio sonorensis TaxID=1004316 RepID=UPI0008DAED86|nr:response regulator [Vibrio sonorensis]